MNAPIISYINKIILDAQKQGASDIHFEPYDKHYRIRMRLDGILYEIATPAHDLADQITARLKIMAQLDISERRLPQDGRFKFDVAEQTFDFRVSTCPTLHGEKIVLRILDPSKTILNIDTLGLEPEPKKSLQEHIRKPQGMILVTGPTGSGKTITLYTLLNILNTAQVNILTIEDPIEIYLPGINQVHINPKAGLNFANVLRAFLRQDPDIIMIGEIRDRETAEIAIKAAQTGHLVLATLHTNNAAASLTRLINMGIPGYNLTSSISLVIAQRLVRRLCNHCKIATTATTTDLHAAGFREIQTAPLNIFAPHGCEHCKQGYQGRCGIFELLPMNDAIAQIIMHSTNANEIIQQACNAGMQTLHAAGLEKIKQGITSLTEINRVIQV